MCSSHLFTNPEFSICDCFTRKKLSSQKNIGILTFIWTLVFYPLDNQKTKMLVFYKSTNF